MTSSLSMDTPQKKRREQKRVVYPEQELNLALDWLEGSMTLTEVTKSLGFNRQGSSTYSFLTARLKAAYEAKLLMIAPAE